MRGPTADRRALAIHAPCRHGPRMDLDALLHHYFGTTDPATLDDASFERGLERAGTDLGTEQEPGRRFALWTLLHALGDAPDPAATFKDPRLREAAQRYALLAARIDEN
ncbi:hypothetical protein ABC347_01635 [Sphingomonas sp. 1P06PA]|uniref:hypothetical protein n=1 Tax=Sphingomonas sp. 1P06PA TaxID=554121 RepID=UPI0039A5382F